METPTNTQGDRIRELFRDASKAIIVAPFIKTDALRSLLEAIPPNVPLRCVTRWRPTEVAAGVSDPEIFDMLQERGKFELLLVDRLHAKLYVADDRCLAGSANVTLSALGDATGVGNIEVLVDTSVDDPGVRDTLATIDREATPASDFMADAIRRFADALPRSDPLADAKLWHPFSRRPEHAYRVYNEGVRDYLTAADRLLLADVARSNILPGLSEQEFRRAIRDLLSAIPIAASILSETEDKLLTRVDAKPVLEHPSDRRFCHTRNLDGFRAVDVVLLRGHGHDARGLRSCPSPSAALSGILIPATLHCAMRRWHAGDFWDLVQRSLCALFPPQWKSGVVRHTTRHTMVESLVVSCKFLD